MTRSIRLRSRNLQHRRQVETDGLRDKKFLGHMLNIGYKNGLALNNFPFEGPSGMTSLADVAEWTEDAMVARGASMVKALLDLYRFDFEAKDEQG